MSRFAIRLAALFAALAAPLALAQPASGPEDALSAPQAPAVQETREEALERLFGELAAETDAKAADAISDRIQQQWAKSGSDSMDLLLRRARDAMNEEKFDRARVHLAALTRLAPEFAEAWNTSATLHYLQQDFGASLAEIQRVLALEPRHYSAMTGLAFIMEQVERPADALAAWREVARLYPAFDKAQEAIDRLAPEVDGRPL